LIALVLLAVFPRPCLRAGFGTPLPVGAPHFLRYRL